MRLDLYLKFVSIVPRRALAKSLIEGGNVLINDKIAKPSSQVENEDTLTIYIGEKTLIVEVSLKQEGKKTLVGGKLIDTKEQGIHKC